LERNTLEESRQFLLSISGIGPETADSILLYAYKFPTFVIDAFTKRIFCRLKIFPGDIKYEEMRLMFLSNLPDDVQLFNEYHALIVRHAKEHCRVKPICTECILTEICGVG